MNYNEHNVCIKVCIYIYMGIKVMYIHVHVCTCMYEYVYVSVGMSYIDDDVEVSHVGVFRVDQLPNSLLLFQFFLCQCCLLFRINR